MSNRWKWLIASYCVGVGAWAMLTIPIFAILNLNLGFLGNFGIGILGGAVFTGIAMRILKPHFGIIR